MRASVSVCGGEGKQGRGLMVGRPPVAAAAAAVAQWRPRGKPAAAGRSGMDDSC